MKNSIMFLMFLFVVSLFFITMVGCGLSEGPDHLDNGSFVGFNESLEDVDQGVLLLLYQ